MTCDHKFVDSNVCLKCGVSSAELRARDAAERAAYELEDAAREYVEDMATAEPPPTYTDDIIETMRATIDQLRRDVAGLRELNEQLRKDAEALAAKFGGPRCDFCGNLCIDLAKDENGYCPDCAALSGLREGVAQR